MKMTLLLRDSPLIVGLLHGLSDGDDEVLLLLGDVVVVQLDALLDELEVEERVALLEEVLEVVLPVVPQGHDPLETELASWN